jgi:plastocyanin
VTSKVVWFAFLIGILLMGLSYKSVDAKTPSISLNQPSEGMSRITVSKGTAIKISNDFGSALYNLMIVKFASGKKMVSIDEFQAGQTFDLEFVGEGTYVICYSLHPQAGSMRDACIQVNVGARHQA